MENENINQKKIESLIDWGGGWAMRALFEDAMSRHLTGSPHNIQLAKQVAMHASGKSAIKYLTNYSQLTRSHIDVGIDATLSPSIRSVLDLEHLYDKFGLGHYSTQWIDRLYQHLGCSKKNAFSAIQAVFEAGDLQPTKEHISLIGQWSWPMIRDMLPFHEEEYLKVEYREDDAALLCWRFWYRDFSNRLFILDSPELEGQRFNEWFVERILHDATHLLHLTCYPNAGSSLDPHWLSVMESVAMFVEFSYLDILTNDEAFTTPNANGFDKDKTIFYLLTNLVKRSLRFDFDILIHLQRRSDEFWYSFVENQLGFSPDVKDFRGFFDFTQEFHGLPGLGSVYMVGVDALQMSVDREKVLKGEEKLTM